MLKALMDAKDSGASFVDDDILGTLTLLIGGGFDTTTSLTAHALTWLDAHPEQRGDLEASQHHAIEARTLSARLRCGCIHVSPACQH